MVCKSRHTKYVVEFIIFIDKGINILRVLVSTPISDFKIILYCIWKRLNLSTAIHSVIYIGAFWNVLWLPIENKRCLFYHLNKVWYALVVCKYHCDVKLICKLFPWAISCNWNRLEEDWSECFTIILFYACFCYLCYHLHFSVTFAEQFFLVFINSSFLL